jgi:hypothetical protein
VMNKISDVLNKVYVYSGDPYSCSCFFCFPLIQFSYNEHKDVEIVLQTYIYKKMYHTIYP